MMFLHIRYLVLIIFLSFFVQACLPIPKVTTESFELVVLHMNDTHSAFDPTIQAFQLENPKETVYLEVGGHPRLGQVLHSMRSELEIGKENFLVLHGGDAWQGSAYFSLNEGRMNADILNRLGIDGSALGNHEFDLNNEKLNDYLSQLNFPVIASNVDLTLDHFLAEQENLLPFVLYAFAADGTKTRHTQVSETWSTKQLEQVVAVIGVALEDMPQIASQTGQVRFEPMREKAQKTIDALHEKGVHKIVAVTHIGLQQDIALAKAVQGIDLIVGGHSHTLLGDFSQVGWGYAGDYAQQVKNPGGLTSTCVVQAGQSAQALGRVRVSFDTQGRVRNCQGKNHLLVGHEVYQDIQKQQPFGVERRTDIKNKLSQQANFYWAEERAALRAHIDKKYKPALQSAYGKKIGYASQPIQHVRLPGENGSDSHGSRLAPIVAQAYYWWMSLPDVIKETGLKPDFALIGAGSIRTSLSAGEIRAGHIGLELLPFHSHLSILPMTGTQIYALLTDVIEQTLEEKAHTGKFPYAGNLRYTYRQSVGLTQVDINRGTLREPLWEPVEKKTTYHMVTTHYSAAGNDGWDLLYQWQKNSSQRKDVVLVDDQARAFSVQQVKKEAGGGYQTLYKTQMPVCSSAQKQMQIVFCGLDAHAVQVFIEQSYTNMQPLQYPTVTLLKSE